MEAHKPFKCANYYAKSGPKFLHSDMTDLRMVYEKKVVMFRVQLLFHPGNIITIIYNYHFKM